MLIIIVVFSLNSCSNVDCPIRVSYDCYQEEK